ncbi:MAG: lytic transglycosylase domain-containing protein [Rhodospirillales bacterium]|nr:lytic transglycosylase domain-containing protein [Rhodospirillales bacterium]
MQPLHLVTVLLICVILLPLTALRAEAKDPSQKEPGQAGIGILKQSLGLIDKGRSLPGRQLARTAGNQLVHDLVLFFDLRRKSGTADFDSIVDLLERHPDWPQTARIARKAETALNGAEQPGALIAFFSRFPPQSGQAALAYIRALESRGNRLAVEEAVRAAWRSTLLEEADEAVLLSRYRHRLRAEDHLARFHFLIGEDDREAVRQGALVGPGYPELAAARLALKAHKSGAAALIGRLPDPLQDDPSLQIDLAGYYHRAGQYGKLDAHLLRLGAVNAGRPEEIWRLRFAAAHRNLRNGKAAQAYRLSRDHGLFSGSGFAELEWLAGYIALEKRNDPGTALGHFKRYYENSIASPISRGKASFWAARAAEAAGDPQEAMRWLSASAAEPASFYGQLAAARLGRTPGTGLPQQPAFPQQTYDELRASGLGQAMTLLARASQGWRTDLFFQALRQRSQSQAEFQSLARLSEGLGRIDLQIKAGKAARRKGFVLIDDLFPRPAWVRPGTPEQALVLALIRQESEFNERAVSHADALGLMQLLPSTARGVAKRLGLDYNRARLVLDPGYNITLGRRYLQEMIQRYGGSYILALTSYNAGPQRTDRWLTSNGDPRRNGTDFVLWVEDIPFAETRNYVMRVLESLTVYRNLLGQTDVLAWKGYSPAGQGPEDARQAICCR